MKKLFSSTLGLLLTFGSAFVSAEETRQVTIFDPISYAARLVGEATALPTITIGGMTFGGWLSSQTSEQQQRKKDLASAQKEANEYLAQKANVEDVELSDYPRLAGLVEDMKLLADAEQGPFSEEQAIEVIAQIETSDAL